ncbi:hypothetical protein HGM15179_013057, partial [Zosterops borbonicus]
VHDPPSPLVDFSMVLLSGDAWERRTLLYFLSPLATEFRCSSCGGGSQSVTGSFGRNLQSLPFPQ